MLPIQKYITAFQKLRIDRTHGIAPHKPILLLSVLQAFQRGFITGNRIYITPELVGLFKTNWSLLVITPHDCRFSYPFFYMKSAFFWKLVPKYGFESVELNGAIMKSFSSLNAAIDYAVIEEELADFMSDQTINAVLQHVLLDTYFEKTKDKLRSGNNLQFSLFDAIENKILSEPSVLYKQEMHVLMQEKNEEEIYLRGSVFRREIPKIYNNTCCISGMRVDAMVSVSMIDACHIIPFSVGYDDTISNGIALCPNLHRAFDRGLIAIDDDYRVMVSPNLAEISSPYSIKAFESKQINLPSITAYHPIKQNFEWHRENVYKPMNIR